MNYMAETTSLISPFQLYLGMIVSGICAGIGSAIGTYLVNKYFVKNTSRLIKKLDKRIKHLHQRVDEFKHLNQREHISKKIRV